MRMFLVWTLFPGEPRSTGQQFPPHGLWQISAEAGTEQPRSPADTILFLWPAGGYEG